MQRITATSNDMGLHVYVDAKQKHLGYKKVRDQSEAAVQTGRCDQKLAEAKKLLYQRYSNGI